MVGIEGVGDHTHVNVQTTTLRDEDIAIVRAIIYVHP